eukprot:scaffold21966_cov80-Skeletonema_marinoi.AAC.1
MEYSLLDIKPSITSFPLKQTQTSAVTPQDCIEEHTASTFFLLLDIYRHRLSRRSEQSSSIVYA